jgi:gliding motility-associated protein GldL
MAAKKSPFFDKILPALYSLGAAVVIFGAWAKILHKDFADIMLTVGLLTEAAIFLTFAFQSYFQETNEYEWERVYPELDSNYKGTGRAVNEAKGLGNQLDSALSNSGLNSDVFNSLKTGISNLSDTASKMADLGNASLATKSYTESLQSASGLLNEYNTSIKSTTGTISELNKAYQASVSEITQNSGEAKEYRNQVSEFNKKMGALNAAYDVELQETNKHLKSLNGLYSNINSAIENLSEAGKDSITFKNEMNKLNANVSSLNSVYGSMLSAMKS